MSAFDWHPRYHRAALDGMLMLTLEERGAYNTVLDLIYDRGGPIPDDARWLSGWMGVSLRKWQSLRATLIVKGKIKAGSTPEGDVLSNDRAVTEVENQAKRQRNLAETGAKGGRKRAENASASNENNDVAKATLEGSLKLKTETETETETVTVEDKSSTAQVIELDPDADAWRQVVELLMAHHPMKAEQAKKFFGRLISENHLRARELLPAIGQAKANGTNDPRSYLTKAAQHVRRRLNEASEPKPAKRVGWV